MTVCTFVHFHPGVGVRGGILHKIDVNITEVELWQEAGGLNFLIQIFLAWNRRKFVRLVLRFYGDPGVSCHVGPLFCPPGHHTGHVTENYKYQLSLKLRGKTWGKIQVKIHWNTLITLCDWMPCCINYILFHKKKITVHIQLLLLFIINIIVYAHTINVSIMYKYLKIIMHQKKVWSLTKRKLHWWTRLNSNIFQFSLLSREICLLQTNSFDASVADGQWTGPSPGSIVGKAMQTQPKPKLLHHRSKHKVATHDRLTTARSHSLTGLSFESIMCCHE